MIPKEITREHVLAALARIKLEGVPRGRDSRGYLLRHGDRTYPPKYAVALAAEIATGQLLPSDVFGGGRETNDFLRARGFVIVNRQDGVVLPPLGVLPRTPAAPARRAPSPRGGHDERCSECKNAIADCLRALYGATGVVRREHRLPLPAKLSAYVDHPRYDDLRRIHRALVAHRGHEAFTRTARIRPLDIFVDPPGFVVELDEGQHFSAARRVSLEAYPDDLDLGFDLGSWIQLCQRLKRSDPDPAYRDEQRAWYDALRDFAPDLHERHLQPTVRIPLGEMAWCELDPSRPKDLERFTQMVPGLPGPAAPVGTARRPPGGSRVPKQVDAALAALQAFERGMQEIRLCYLRWALHPGFSPPSESVAGIGAGETFQTLSSPNGNSFTLSPCGWGSSYAGGGRGSVKMPAGVWPEDAALSQRTQAARAQLGRTVRAWRSAVKALVDAGHADEAWALAQDYFWVKLGVHEFAFDFTHGMDMPKGSVRDKLVHSMRFAEDLRHTWRQSGFSPQDLVSFSARTQWHRYACCSFDCGPIVLSRGRFVRYAEVAEAIRKRPRGPAEDAWQWVFSVLSEFYEPVVAYDGDLLWEGRSVVGIRQQRSALAGRVGEIEALLSECGQG